MDRSSNIPSPHGPPTGFRQRWRTGRGAFTTGWRRSIRYRRCSFTHGRTVARWRLPGLEDGMRVLEVATGSGEMFRRMVRANPNGSTMGVDLSPNMASRTQRRARREFPRSRAHCQAVDARQMPFRDESFDAVVCCYLLELLSAGGYRAHGGGIPSRAAAAGTAGAGADRAEHGRVQPACTRLAATVAPAFWGRQVERSIPEVIRAAEFRIVRDEAVKQGFYPSRVLVARK